MQRYGLKTISLDQVNKDYDSIIKNTHFIANEKQPVPDLTDLKPISSDMVGILMTLGTEGLHFLGNILKGSHDIPELTPEDQWEIYCACDGFGKLSGKELKDINDGWDWSHVRDSSPEALKEACDMAKIKLIQIYNKY